MLAAALLSAASPLCGAQASPLQEFDSLIQRLDAQDPNAPQALEMHLRYAKFLASSEEGECAPRLAAAQAQLERVQSNPAAELVLLAGGAHQADVSYLIHLARAPCGPPAERERELRTALTAAQRSAALYGDEFDYVSMATMQYNLALTYQSLGEEAQALAALRAVLASDREYGFRDDAAENTQLLLRLSHLDSGPAQVEAQMKDFPVRSTTLKFAWPAGESEIKIESDYARSVGGQVLRAHGERRLLRRVQKRAFHWVISYQARDSHYTLDDLPALPGVESGFMRSFAGLLLSFHDIDLIDIHREDGAPDFRQTLDQVSFSNRVRSDADALLRDLDLPARAAAALKGSLESVLKGALQRESVEQQAALDFNIEAGAWPGATLQQGVWYELQMPLPLPYAPLILVNHTVEFAFTRPVPCTADAATPRCVEIVMRAVPEQSDMQRVLKDMQRSAHLPRGQVPRSAATTTIRLITDPDSLTPMLRDIQRQAYLSADGGASASLLSCEKIKISAGRVTPAAD